ncbi:MAG UNVERIFIED_CONTAM: quinolinate synthase NadA [Planctomycetaceae bacterium]
MVHEVFSIQDLIRIRKQNPGCLVMAHPECPRTSSKSPMSSAAPKKCDSSSCSDNSPPLSSSPPKPP